MRLPSLWTAAAVTLFTLALASVFGGVWLRGPSQSVATTASIDPSEYKARWATLNRGDLLYNVAVVARNARVLVSEPSRLFDPTHCYPLENSLTLSEPMINLGLLGVPAWLASRDPVVTYNFATQLIVWIGALAMYALVLRWSGSAPAGIVAGLLYAFSYARLHTAIHPYVNETTGLVLGLLFAREWFAFGRWRDALGVGLCGAFTLLGSFYPVLVGTILAVPVGVWLLRREGWRRLAPLQVASVAAILVVTAWFAYAPHLAVDTSREFVRVGGGAGAGGSGGDSPSRIVDNWHLLLPGSDYFPGWLTLALMACAFLPRRARDAADAAEPADVDPRWPLVVAIVVLGLVGAAGNPVALREGTAWHGIAFPNLWAWLAAFVPGMERVRRSDALFAGINLAATLLAGLGVAALLRRLRGRAASGVAAALIALTFLYVVRPFPLLGEPPVRYRVDVVAPPARLLAFFDGLAARGNAGPLLEVGLPENAFERRAAAMLLATYHRRPTSACYGSFLPVRWREIQALVERLPAPDAVAEARDLGFTTVLLHRPRDPERRAAQERLFEAASRGPQAVLRPLGRLPAFTALEIR